MSFLWDFVCSFFMHLQFCLRVVYNREIVYFIKDLKDDYLLYQFYNFFSVFLYILLNEKYAFSGSQIVWLSNNIQNKRVWLR